MFLLPFIWYAFYFFLLDPNIWIPCKAVRTDQSLSPAVAEALLIANTQRWLTTPKQQSAQGCQMTETHTHNSLCPTKKLILTAVLSEGLPKLFSLPRFWNVSLQGLFSSWLIYINWIGAMVSSCLYLLLFMIGAAVMTTLSSYLWAACLNDVDYLKLGAFHFMPPNTNTQIAASLDNEDDWDTGQSPKVLNEALLCLCSDLALLKQGHCGHWISLFRRGTCGTSAHLYLKLTRREYFGSRAARAPDLFAPSSGTPSYTFWWMWKLPVMMWIHCRKCTCLVSYIVPEIQLCGKVWKQAPDQVSKAATTPHDRLPFTSLSLLCNLLAQAASAPQF